MTTQAQKAACSVLWRETPPAEGLNKDLCLTATDKETTSTEAEGKAASSHNYPVTIQAGHFQLHGSRSRI